MEHGLYSHITWSVHFQDDLSCGQYTMKLEILAANRFLSGNFK